jgi:hypothetical protein
MTPTDVRRLREAQGLPATIQDRALLERVAHLLARTTDRKAPFAKKRGGP